MPGLKLGILLNEKFMIGNIVVTMVQIKSPTWFVVEVARAMKERFEINDKKPVEVIPGVTIVAGVNGATLERPDGSIYYRPVVVIDAPQHYKIHRLKGEERFAKA